MTMKIFGQATSKANAFLLSAIVPSLNLMVLLTRPLPIDEVKIVNGFRPKRPMLAALFFTFILVTINITLAIYVMCIQKSAKLVRDIWREFHSGAAYASLLLS
jgi:hypothetical protein